MTKNAQSQVKIGNNSIWYGAGYGYLITLKEWAKTVELLRLCASKAQCIGFESTAILASLSLSMLLRFRSMAKMQILSLNISCQNAEQAWIPIKQYQVSTKKFLKQMKRPYASLLNI